MNIKAFKEQANIHLERLEILINSMPNKGLKCEDSQKICLLDKLNRLDYTFNGIEEEDFIPDEKYNHFCGQTNIPVGAKIQIIKSNESDEDWLIGIKGVATHPFAFGCTEKGWIGIWIDEEFIENPYGTQMNIHKDEIKIIV